MTVNANNFEGNFFHSEKSIYDDYCVGIEEAIKSDFCFVDLKKKCVGYLSVMHFDGRLASGPDDICNVFADFIQRTYADDAWVSSDPGPDLVQDDPPFGSLQFTVDEVQSVLLELDVSKGASAFVCVHFLYFLTELYRHVFFVSFRFVSFRFVSFRFVSFRFVSFRFVSFRFVFTLQ
jgi:hypothetical protein